jgi:hypothetical protein
MSFLIKGFDFPVSIDTEKFIIFTVEAFCYILRHFLLMHGKENVIFVAKGLH